ncbi:hypothetical protein BGW36DRAFT_127096 [Talaromyces proteolyticus]|uniref:Uncharacterized protein n=1 Tax=Talaromyces proteolyticus TaxID=1131652 RepID=A0AAD4KVI0_9EURO|nr:uncharacterized protein BGW36DRAFT_127096 [Talaromyces proteolyticus]KAH8700338.1 hypothetical protein BGW36DRAFT_127096 [Talaromyces proteolyticus]
MHTVLLHNPNKPSPTHAPSDSQCKQTARQKQRAKAMCFFSAYLYCLCGHIDYDISTLCVAFKKQLLRICSPTNLSNPSCIPFSPNDETCLPHAPDPRLGVAGNLQWFYIVLPGDIGPTASLQPLCHRLRELQSREDREGWMVVSGLCGGCTSAAEDLCEMFQACPSFGLTDDMVLDEDGNENGMDDSDVSKAEDFDLPFLRRVTALDISSKAPGAMEQDKSIGGEISTPLRGAMGRSGYDTNRTYSLEERDIDMMRLDEDGGTCIVSGMGILDDPFVGPAIPQRGYHDEPVSVGHPEIPHNKFLKSLMDAAASPSNASRRMRKRARLGTTTRIGSNSSLLSAVSASEANQSKKRKTGHATSERRVPENCPYSLRSRSKVGSGERA